MSIASEKIKAASERFLLIRINPARYVLPVLNGGLYELTLPFIINRVERNGVALTKDSSAPSVNDHWFQDEDTKLLQVKLASSPNSTTNVLIVYYYLFYTGTIYRAISEDPEDSNTTIREWLPYIQNYPSILQSFDGIYNGVFTINDTSIEILNTDKSFQDYLSDDDSFYNKLVDIWICINDVSNIQKIFTGTIKNLTVAKNIVTLNAVDSFNKLKNIASMGDDTDEIYFSLNGFPDVDPTFRDSPIPYIVGKTSRYTTSIYGVPAATTPLAYSINGGNRAICTSIEVPLNTSTNRTWGCSRQKGQIATQNFGTIGNFLDLTNGFYLVEFVGMSNVNLGDTLKFNVSDYGLVQYIGDFSYLGNDYNCIIKATAGVFLNTSPLINSKSFAISIFDSTTGEYSYPIYGRDYTVDDSVITQGNNRYIDVTFVNNFEAVLTTLSQLDPIKHHVFYRTSTTSIQTHSQMIIDILDLVAIPHDTTSFTNAQTALNVNAAFQIPNFDEQDYDLYLKYVQDILASTLGFLRINSDFEVQYYLLAAPSSSDIRDQSLIIQDSNEIDIEYQDIQTKIIAFNPHNSSEFATSFTPSPSVTSESTKARYLSGLENVTRFRHVLETITARISSHIGLKSMRFAKYKFQTATEDIDTELGKDIEMQNNIVLGGSEISDLKIITVEKSPKFVSLEASDFKGL